MAYLKQKLDLMKIAGECPSTSSFVRSAETPTTKRGSKMNDKEKGGS